MENPTTIVTIVLILVSILIGLDKSLLPGAGILGVAILATVVPAKTASGTTLALIVIADWTAIWAYRHDVDWRTLGKLLPNVVIGVLCGAGFLFVASDDVTKRTIGVILLVFIAANLLSMLHRRRARKTLAAAVDEIVPGETVQVGTIQAEAGAGASGGGGEAGAREAGARARVLRAKRIGYGALAGFTTMVANAGGPVTSMYFLSEGFPVATFLGTTAWFYLVINLVKLPFSIGLGMITWATLVTVMWMIPVIVATVFAGRFLASRIDRRVFNAIVVGLTIVTAAQLLL